MLIGYARVSDSSQSLDIQLAALEAAGCEKIFSEKVSGRSTDNRPELLACVEFARSQDQICVTKLDRWARSVRDLHNLLNILDEKGVGFLCLDQAIDTTSSAGRLTLAILGAVASFELDIRAERQREGIEARKRKGLYKGRQSMIDLDRVRQLSERMKPAEVAAVMGISRASVYRAMANISAAGALPTG
jgi:DNA invertase Pin-like site-specific DNA recombinase